ncbi:uncharacterized protein LOC134529910 [Bacillus rossius redtenbacheri]|uniref:uncharacterized protein LOC134529910 n=1 Tax=Bacillus rossius redtenbacheri TaxID=93214 RepID=UPI002FDCD94C
MAAARWSLFAWALLVARCASPAQGKPAMSITNDLQLLRACNTTSPVSLDTLNSALINRQLSTDKTLPFKCFLHCMYTKYEIMDEKGNFLQENMRDSLASSELDLFTTDLLIYRCIKTGAESQEKCERAFLFTQCFWTETLKMTEEEYVMPDEYYNKY